MEQTVKVTAVPPTNVIRDESGALAFISGPNTNSTRVSTNFPSASGYWSGPHDDQMGRKLRNAVMRFQSDLEIPVTGKFDPETLHFLGIAD